MTKAQAADLHAKWKQEGDPPPACQHALQELASSELDDHGHVLNTYHCRDCGKRILHRLMGNSLSHSLLMEPESLNEL